MTKKTIKEPKKIGRPTKYTKAIGEEICATIASSELGLAHLIEQNPHWPVRSTIFVWIRTHPEFKDMYTRAKEDQTEVVVEYMQELMNEPHKFVDEETGFTKIDVQMLRLKIDTMKWHASKLKPKKFGEAKDVELPNTELDEDCKKRYADMDKRNRKEY
jgi:hypothetical protein